MIQGPSRVPIILRKLPYFDNETHVTLPRATNPVLVKGTQIIVWVAVTRITELTPVGFNRFPAILDTGFTQNLCIGAQQLLDWAGFNAADLPHVGSSDIDMPGRQSTAPLQVPRHAAFVCLYRNELGQRDPVINELPFNLQIVRGITVYPDGFPAPRLPLLGLRGLQWSKLRLQINSEARYVSLRSPFVAPVSMQGI
jgi:hypothetical protein